MATEVKMPQLGETVVEGTITKWLKQEGDTIEEDELLVEISTDKVDSEVPSSAAGTIQKILVQEGDTVSVGTPLALIGDGDAASEPSEGSSDEGGKKETGGSEDDSEEETKEGESQVAQEQGEEGAPSDEGQAEGDATPGQEEKKRAEVGESDDTEAQANDTEKGAEPEPSAAGTQPESAPAEAAASVKARQNGNDGSKRGIISPLVRRLADENDVELGEVEGTGTGGRIRKQDVLRFVEEKKSRPAAPAATSEPAPEPDGKGEQAAPARPAAVSSRKAGEREELVPWTNIRRRTAEHMVASSRETARAWNAVEADWTNVVKLRGRAKGRFKEREGFNLTFMPFLAKAVCDTLMEMPEVNSTFDEENQANLVKHYVNLGIAVALDGGGLIVPVIQGADEKNIPGLARSINDVATRARSKKLSPDDLTGGTFTITNPGPFGSKMSVPIIPRGQAAILAFEAIEKRVVVTDDDAIAIRSMGFLPMSWDHRVIDGAEAARFLASLRDRIETTDFSQDLSPYL
jgi:2-oxoglutarate dehydrogenase E2 component (dihydrolipoamide succinyltransferase)